MGIEDMNPTDVRWEIIKDVYNKNVTNDIKKTIYCISGCCYYDVLYEFCSSIKI